MLFSKQGKGEQIEQLEECLCRILGRTRQSSAAREGTSDGKTVS